MVLGQPHRVKAKLLGELRLRDGLIDDAFIQLRIAAFRKQEVAELHAVLLFGHRDGVAHLAANPPPTKPPSAMHHRLPAGTPRALDPPAPLPDLPWRMLPPGSAGGYSGNITARPSRADRLTAVVHSMYFAPVTKSVCVTRSLPRMALMNSSSTRQPPRFAGSISTGSNAPSPRLPAESAKAPPTGCRSRIVPSVPKICTSATSGAWPSTAETLKRICPPWAMVPMTSI